MKVIRRNDPTHLNVSRTSLPRELYFFYEKNTGVSHFHVEAGNDGQFPVEQAAGLLAMHCLVRGQSPRDYVVMVQAAQDSLEGLTEKAVWHVVREYARKAGIEKLTLHDLRRTCARLCHAAGGELEQIQFLLGHVSIQTTERYLGCKQRIRSAVNDRIGIEPAN